MAQSFRYIYGPVESWRMGKSLGIDPLSDSKKICNLDCVYCQLGRSSQMTNERKDYVATDTILREVVEFFRLTSRESHPAGQDINYLTFSGRGEPTLASNLGEMIEALRLVRPEPIAVITNSTLMHLPQVRRDLSAADLVMAKLDAFDERSFAQVDAPMSGISFQQTWEGLKDFRASYQGKLAVQIMFTAENQGDAPKIAQRVRAIDPHEVQINTPLRPSSAKPLDEDSIVQITSHFNGMPVVSVYEQKPKATVPLDAQATIKRHGNFKSQHRPHRTGGT